jgi:hypothetical protein
MARVARTKFSARDPLELLFDGDHAAEQRAASQLVRFFRILASDVAGLEEQAPCLDDEIVQAEYAREGRRRVVVGIEGLLRHYLGWYLGGRSFLYLKTPEEDATVYWTCLAQELGESSVRLPGPGESCMAIVSRLVEAFELHAGLHPDASALWRARMAHAARGPVAGEGAFRSVLEGLPGDTGDALGAVDLVRRRAVEGVAEALLDRGSARLAAAWLSEHADLVRRGVRLRRLTVWARMLCGDVAGARRAQAHLEAWAGRLPDALVELRGRHPELLPLLSGVGGGEQRHGIWPPRAHGEALQRSDFGAIACVIFRLEPGVGARPVRAEVAPTLTGSLDAWLAERALTPFDQGSAEQALLATADSVITHREEGQKLQGAIGPENSMAMLLEPLLDSAGDVVGWVHLELEHHLVPEAARRLELQRAALEELRSDGSGQGTDARSVSRRKGPGPITRAFEELVQHTGMKLARRRWWGLERDGEGFMLVADGGEGLTVSLENHMGQAGVLRRAQSAGGPVSFDEPDQRLSLHPAAASGIALPLGPRGQASALLLVESSRRADFAGRPRELLIAAVEEWGGAVHLAQFARWYGERFGSEPHLPVASLDFRAFAQRVARVGRSRQVAVVSGPGGVGKSVLARWLHYEGPARDGPIHVMPGSLADAELLRQRLGGEADRTLVLEGVEELDHEAQVALSGHLEEARARSEVGPRLIVTSERGLAQAAKDGLLRRDLAGQLDRLGLFIPPLADRREEIEGLIRHFLSQESEGERDWELEEEALAILWRQPWSGGVRELENFVCKLANETEGSVGIDAEIVTRVASEGRCEFIARIPSRHPRRTDVLAALMSTRTGGGRVNKTRAARFLGWDPDTLVARMSDLHIAEDGFSLSHRPWTAHGT